MFTNFKSLHLLQYNYIYIFDKDTFILYIFCFTMYTKSAKKNFFSESDSDGENQSFPLKRDASVKGGVNQLRSRFSENKGNICFTYWPSLKNGSDQLIVPLHIYTIYISLCTQTADPNHFRGTHCSSTCEDCHNLSGVLYDLTLRETIISHLLDLFFHITSLAQVYYCSHLGTVFFELNQ